MGCPCVSSQWAERGPESSRLIAFLALHSLRSPALRSLLPTCITPVFVVTTWRRPDDLLQSSVLVVDNVWVRTVNKYRLQPAIAEATATLPKAALCLLGGWVCALPSACEPHIRASVFLRHDTFEVEVIVVSALNGANDVLHFCYYVGLPIANNNHFSELRI